MAATHHHLDGRDCLTDTDLTIDVFTGLEAVDIASRGIRHLYADEIEMLADLAGFDLQAAKHCTEVCIGVRLCDALNAALCTALANAANAPATD